MASPLDSATLLDRLLGGEVPPVDLIDELLRRRVRESVWLDYKSGTLFDDKTPKEAVRLLRRHVAGFANAEGGVLIIGAHNDEPNSAKWSVVPCTKHEGRLVKWAQDALAPLLGYLDPFPRIHEVVHPVGPLLFVAVARAPALVPCIEDGRPVHYLRFADSTRAAPDYLLADIALGRRSHPVLRLGHHSAQTVVERGNPQNFKQTLTLGFWNESVVWVEGLMVGLVGDHVGSGRPNTEHLSETIRSRIDIGERVAGVRPNLRRPQNTFRPDMRIAPFDTHHFRFDLSLPLTLLRYRWTGLFFIVPRGHPASWYEITVEGRQAGRRGEGIPHKVEAPTTVRQLRGIPATLSCIAVEDPPA